MCMIHLAICACLNSSPIALLAHHLHYVNDCYVYDLTFMFLYYVVQLKCHGISSLMFARVFPHLLFLTLGYTIFLGVYNIFLPYGIFQSNGNRFRHTASSVQVRRCRMAKSISIGLKDAVWRRRTEKRWRTEKDAVWTERCRMASWTEDAVWRNRFPLNKINVC